MELTWGERQIDNLVMVGVRTEAHTLRSQVGIGSESDCLLGQLNTQTQKVIHTHTHTQTDRQTDSDLLTSSMTLSYLERVRGVKALAVVLVPAAPVVLDDHSPLRRCDVTAASHCCLVAAECQQTSAWTLCTPHRDRQTAGLFLIQWTTTF